MISFLQRSLLVCFLSLLTVPLLAAETDAQLEPGEFAAADAGTYIAGELVFIDPVNRRGGIRLDGDEKGRYHTGPLHYFALLPYGTVWHNGSLAEIRDIPIGTHVHGYFVVPPKGEEATIGPLPNDQKQFTIRQNHAISLEDDFSFYQRRGQSWKVVSVEAAKDKILYYLTHEDERFAMAHRGRNRVLRDWVSEQTVPQMLKIIENFRPGRIIQ